MSEKVFNVTPLTTTVRTYVAVNPTSSDENLAGYGNFLTFSISASLASPSCLVVTRENLVFEN